MRKDFVALVLTHGRAGNVRTINSLRKHGYTGRIVLVIDNEDKQADDYYRIYGKDDVVMFDKREKAKECDAGDNFCLRNVVLFARNSCHKIAAKLGYKYFVELDDDYGQFTYRHSSALHYMHRNCNQLDWVFELMVDFLETDIRIKAVCMSQGGDYIGGARGAFGDIKLHRKAMNAFVCKTDRPFQFYGYLNEDTTTYTLLGSRGDLFFTLPNICLEQVQTQANSGGLTDAYLDGGTYKKSFYSVMYNPSSVKISMMGAIDMRIHHKVHWRLAVPKILSQKWRKEST